MYAPNIIVEHLTSLCKKRENIVNIQTSNSKSKKGKRAKYSYKNIDRIQNQILQYICVHPDSTAYDIYKKRALYVRGYVDDYKVIRRCINNLHNKGLIERPQKKAIEHGKNHAD